MTEVKSAPVTPGNKLRAVVGSQISRDEEMFGAAFDRKVVRRFMSYVHPYRRAVTLAVLAVLVFTGSQLAIPLIVRRVIDDALVARDENSSLLLIAVAVFAAVIVINYAANRLQDWLVGWTGERVIFDLRRAMFAHMQRISLSFMDRTEVGRMMSRLHARCRPAEPTRRPSCTARLS